MERDIEKIEELYRAHRKQDLKTLLLFVTRDVELVHSPELPWGGRYHGHDGVRQLLLGVSQHLEARLEIERLIDAGDHVVAIGRAIGKARATQLEFDVPIVHVWTFRNGLVVRLESYLDNATMLPVLGT